MRLLAAPDGRVDWIDRALWLSPPLDLSLRRPRCVVANTEVIAALVCRILCGARLDAAAGAASRLAGQLAGGSD